MEQPIVNPYRTPEADLKTTQSTLKATIFSRFSAWWVFLLSVVTFGIYPAYWLYTRTNTANTVTDKPISPALLNIFIVFVVASVIAGFLDASDFAEIVLAVNIIYITIYIVLLFKLRNKLQVILAQKLSPALTFFGAAIYLQYKINQSIDKSTSSN